MVKKKFYIQERDISNGYVTLSEDEYEYDAREKKPNALLWRDGRIEVKNKHVTYKNNTNAGIATVVVQGTNGNKGSIVKYFRIKKRDISKGSIKLLKTNFKDRNSINIKKEDIEVYTKNGGRIYDFDLKSYSVYKNGDVEIRVEGKNNNKGQIINVFTVTLESKTSKKTSLSTGGTGGQVYTINDGQIKISKAKVTNLEKNYTYTGEAIEPNIVLTYGGNTLTKNIDYTLSYKENIEARTQNHLTTAEIKISGIGNYTGTVKKYFTINPLSIDEGNVKFKVNYPKGIKTIVVKKEHVEVYTKDNIKVNDFEILESGINIGGKGYVKIAGTKNYNGNIKKTFMLNDKSRKYMVDFLTNQIGNNGYEYAAYAAEKDYGPVKDKNNNLIFCPDWCCYFLDYCIDRVFGSGTAMDNIGFYDNDNMPEGRYRFANDAGDIARAAEGIHKLHRYDTGYIPKPGDIFIMCRDENTRTHVGFVTGVATDSDGKLSSFTTIEGNSDDRIDENDINYAAKSSVTKNTRTKNTKNGISIGTYVYGFVDLSYWYSK